MPTNLSRRGFLTASSALPLTTGHELRARAAPVDLFPPGFVWGAGSASMQIEGALDADGRGPDIWGPLHAREGVVFGGHTPAGSTDHYHRYREDVALMKQIGLPSYRFSVAWPRVFPEGTGKVNTRGLDFYDRLVDELLRAGVDPYVMLYHWELPAALERRGGWQNRDITGWFSDFAALVTRTLSDRVRHFMTIEEPQVFIGMGYLTGEYAPAYQVGHADYLNAVHNALLAHGFGCQSIRANAKKPVKLGLAFGCASYWPATESPADIEAARRRTFWVEKKKHWNNAWYVDPIVFGKYPEEFARQWQSDMPTIRPGDMATIRQPIDFIGINIYNSRPIKAIDREPGWEALPPNPPSQATAGGKHLLCPQGMYWSPRFFWERYQTPLFITESGCVVPDWVSLDGKVHDPQRIDYTARVLLQLSRAIREGSRVLGYHHWSFLDSFEWDGGYNFRMGLFHVDYGTLKRTPKDSAAFFRELAATNGRNLLAMTHGS